MCVAHIVLYGINSQDVVDFAMVSFCIGAIISTRQEIRCLPYAFFFSYFIIHLTSKKPFNGDFIKGSKTN